MSWSQWLQTLTEVDVKESSPAYLCSVEPSVGFMFGSTLTGPPSGPAPDSHTCCRSRTLRQSRFRSIIQNSPLLLCKAFRWLIRLWDAHWSTNTVVFYLLFTQKSWNYWRKAEWKVSLLSENAAFYPQELLRFCGRNIFGEKELNYWVKAAFINLYLLEAGGNLMWCFKFCFWNHTRVLTCNCLTGLRRVKKRWWSQENINISETLGHKRINLCLFLIIFLISLTCRSRSSLELWSSFKQNIKIWNYNICSHTWIL